MALCNHRPSRGPPPTCQGQVRLHRCTARGGLPLLLGTRDPSGPRVSAMLVAQPAKRAGRRPALRQPGVDGPNRRVERVTTRKACADGAWPLPNGILQRALAHGAVLGREGEPADRHRTGLHLAAMGSRRRPSVLSPAVRRRRSKAPPQRPLRRAPALRRPSPCVFCFGKPTVLHHDGGRDAFGAAPDELCTVGVPGRRRF